MITRRLESLNRKARILHLLATAPEMTYSSMAESVGCSTWTVGRVAIANGFRRQPERSKQPKTDGG